MKLICKLLSRLLGIKPENKRPVKHTNPDACIMRIYNMIGRANTVTELEAAMREIQWAGETYWDYPQMQQICEDMEDYRVEALRNIRSNTINPVYGNSIKN